MAIDYKGFPYITFIEKSVRDELQKREGVDNRTRNVTAWAKVTSGVYRVGKSSSTTMLGANGQQERVDTTETLESSLRTLSSVLIHDDKNPTQLGFSDLYNSNNKPIPGITGLDISYKSEIGGVRIATIKWTAHTLEQFQENAPYFLSPGRTMMLEWGWTNDFGIYALTPEQYEDLIEDKSKVAWLYFHERSLKYNGLYDGMLGIVSNYDFSLRDDGGFDCTTEVISQGTLMYGLNLIHQSEIKNADSGSVPQTTIKDFVKYELQDVVANYIEKNVLPDYLTKILPNKKLPEDADVYYDSNKTYGKSKQSYFVTWGFIEDVIVNPFVGMKYKSSEDKTGGTPVFQLKSIDYDDWVADKSTVKFRSTKISNHKWLRTTDLSTCFIDNESYGPTNNFYAPADDQYDETDLDKSFGYLRNIYINLDVVYNAFMNSDILTDALLKILNEVNAACIQYWDFRVKTNEADQTIRIVDVNYNDKKLEELLKNQNDVPDIYLFRLYGGNGIIRSLDVSSNLSNDITMTSLYGLNKIDDDKHIFNNDNDSFLSIWNQNLNFRDKFVGKLYFETKDINFNIQNKQTEETQNNAEDISKNEDNVHYSDDLKKSMLPRKMQYRLPNQTNYNIEQLDDVTAMKIMVYGAADGKNTTVENKKSNIIVPLTFEMKIEGIAGIKIGDVFFVDAVPDAYIENSVFQITAVDHSIEDNYWETSVKAMLKCSDHKIRATTVRNREVTNTQIDTTPFTGDINPSVIKWIKKNMGPLIAKEVGGTIFNESLIAGIIYAEASGEIRKNYNAGTADAYTVNSKITNPDINIGNQAYTMFQFTSGRVPDNIQKWLDDPDSKWKRPNEAVFYALDLLKGKQRYIENSVALTSDELVRATLAAYNGGEGRVVKALKNGKPLETTTYRPDYLDTIYTAATEYETV